MVNFLYNFNHTDYTPYTYRVTQFRMGTAFEVFSIDDVLIGSISKGQLGWEQYSGRMMPQELVDGIGKHIDDNGLWT
jgi:hypothetical protein